MGLSIKLCFIMLMAVSALATRGGTLEFDDISSKPIMLGAPSKSQDNLKDAIDMILKVPELGDKMMQVQSILGGAKLLKSTSQVVAGVNHVYLFETSRGFECMRIYEPLFDACEVSRYARGTNQGNVLRECNSFNGLIKSTDNVKAFLSN